MEFLKNIKFFNKKGYEITPYFDEFSNSYKISLNLGRVSEKLFETEHIFIFEEVLIKRDEIIKNQQLDEFYLNQIKNTPRIIRFLIFLKNLNDKNIKANKSNLFEFFRNERLDKNYIEDFINKHTEFIDVLYDFETHYIINNNGLKYLEDYFDKIKSYRDFAEYESFLTRPRMNYNPQLGEKTYLIFKWKDDKFDDNIMLFDISQEKIKVLKHNNLSTPELDEEYEELPVVRFYKNDSLNFKISNQWVELSSNFIFDVSTSEEEINSKIKILPSKDKLNPNPFKINIAFTGEIEGFYTRTLEVYLYTKRIPENQNSAEVFVKRMNKILEIEISGTIIAEDERFKKLLENFGRNIDLEDYRVIRDYDLDDDLFDYIKINEKRKELLLIGDEIFNHLGSYKCLKNALNWLGYRDITIREYFYNIKSYNEKNKLEYKYLDFDIFNEKYDFDEKIDYQIKKYSDIFLNKNWGKTTRLGLIYSYNRFTGEYDSFGYPVIENNLDFDPDEVLLKLYGLKKVLYKYFLPHNARIINISLEGIYFIKVILRTWKNFVQILKINKTTDFDFYAINTRAPLINLEKFISDYYFYLHKNEFDEIKTLNDLNNKENNKIINFNNLILKNIILKENILDNYFENFELKNKFINNFKKITILSQTINTFLKNVEFKNQKTIAIFLLKFKNAEIRWNDLNGIPWGFFDIYTFTKNVDEAYLEIDEKFKEKYYKIFDFEIIEDLFEDLTYGITDDNKNFIKKIQKLNFTWEIFNYDDNTLINWYIENEHFRKEITGKLKKLKEIFLFLPYEGKYNISLFLKDSTNFLLSNTKKKYLEVYNNYSNEIIAFGRYFNEINFNNLEFDKINDWFTNAKELDIKTTWDDADIEWYKLEFNNYLDQNFFICDLKSYEILKIDEKNRTIILKDSHFYNDFLKFKNNHYKNELVFFNDRRKIKKIRNLKFTQIHDKIFINKNLLEDKKYDFYNISFYKRLEIYSFNYKKINENSNDVKITIKLTDKKLLNKFKINTYIYYYIHGSEKEFRFLIKDIEINYINNLISIYAKNIDVDFLYEKNYILDSQELNFKNKIINKLVYEYDNEIYRISSHVIENNKNVFKILNLNKKFNTDEYFAELNFYSDFITLDLNKVKIKLDSNKNTEILVNKDFNLKFIDLNFKVYYSDYNISHAKKFGTVNFIWKNLDEVCWNDTQNQNWATIDYHSEISNYFIIADLEKIEFPFKNKENKLIYPRIPKIFITTFDNKKYVYEIKFPQIISVIKDQQFRNRFKALYILNFLKKINDNILGSFEFYLIDGGKKILAINREGFLKNTIFKEIKSEVIKIDRENTIPTAVWLKFEKIFNIKCDNWCHYNRLPTDENDFHYIYSGCFNFNDTFITKLNKKLILNKFTPVFFTIKDDNNFNLKYEWKIYNNENKLLIKSKNKFVIYNFVKSGNYKIILNIFNLENRKIKTIEKNNILIL